MSGKRKTFLAISSSIILLLPLAFVLYFHSSEISLDPPKFVQEYLKFLGGLVSVFLAFYLVNIFWTGERGTKKAGQLRQLCIIHLDSMYKICMNIRNVHNLLLERTWDANSWEEMLEIDKNALKHLERIDYVYNKLVQLSDEHSEELVYDPLLKDVMFELLEEIGPLIQSLSALNSTIPNKTLVNGHINDLIDKIHKARITL